MKVLFITNQVHMNILALVDNSPSMSDEAKKWWYGTIPTLKTEQLERLEEILQEEHTRLLDIEKAFII